VIYGDARVFWKSFYIVVERVKLSRYKSALLKLTDETMERVCFVLQVKPERIQEYKERHRVVWPEMQDALRETGWNNYSLFLRQDGLLVGYLETESFERARAGMASRKINERWQREMAGFFVQPEGLLPDQAMASLEEVFHI
jgi:L-rhamnose mutarotase